MTPKLYGMGESGNVYKAALTMTLCGIDYETVWVDFFNGAARTPEFKALNPMAEVPVLEVDGRVMTQSGVMQIWAAERAGRYMGDRDETLRWLFFDNHKVSSQAGPARFMANFLPPEKRNMDVIRWVQGRLNAALDTMESELARRDWLAGPEATIADFACCSYLYYPEPFGFDRAARPAISAWLDRIAALPGWRHPYDLLPRVEGKSPSLAL